MFEVVRRLLGLRWSLEQIALILVTLYSKDLGYSVSPENIVNCNYAQPVGEHKCELVSCLRQVHNKRVPRSKGQDRGGQIPDMLFIRVRPPEIENRQFPGHWEGDLIKGEATASVWAQWSSAPAACSCWSNCRTDLAAELQRENVRT